MEIQLTAKQLKITDAIRNYVHAKMEKAQKYFDHIVWGQAFLFIEKRSHNCEMLIHAPGQTFRALAAAADLYSAVDLASDKIDAQMKKFKEKVRTRYKTRHGKDTVRREELVETLPPLAQFAVIRQPVAPMTANEAVRDMEALGQSFRLYQDRGSKQIQAVFRRSDESYGIVQPVKKAAR
ncbi:MAG TPA: ribosome-associated translation inhibitor RaiA [Elusimicrobia bacterium]|nr:ribosome-associated translation inhibitor RaiA [Elusimicrobiota bacterium]HBT61856.1 ribosome-associated translation inhibitor RaiA [Elusimicrobiota bacterium]